MISTDLVISATIVLLTGAVVFLAFRKASPAARHLVCASTLFVSILLPFVAKLPIDATPDIFRFVVNGPAAAASSHASWLIWAPTVWLAGAIATIAQFVLGIAYLVWKTRHSSFDGCLHSSRVSIRLAAVSSPLVWGWLRPTILLPLSAAEWSADRKNLAVAHERAHISRYDCWFALLDLLARALYWFHPLVWWLSAKLKEQRELACDEQVLAGGVAAPLYAALLLETANELSAPVLFGCGMIDNRNQLRKRVENILAYPGTNRRFDNRLAAAATLLILFSTSLVVPARAEAVYKIGGDVLAPKVIKKFEPQYTKRARHDKIQGAVLIDLIVGANGRPKNIRVERSLAPDLDKQAARSVSSWRFDPATRSGKPVSVQAKIEVHFRLL